MENQQPIKRYRVLKFTVLAILMVVAVGLAIYTKDGRQAGDPLAKVEDGASSMMAGAKQPGEKLMDKAAEIKDGMGDGLARESQKVARMASDTAHGAGLAVETAVESVNERIESVKSTANDIEAAKNTTQPGGIVDVGLEKLEEIPAAYKPEAIRMANDQTGMDPTDMAASRLHQAIEAGVEKGREMAADSIQVGDTTDLPSGTTEAAGTLTMDAPTLSPDTTAGVMGNDPGQQARDVSSATETFARSPMTGTAGDMGMERDDAAVKRCVGVPPKGRDLGDRYIVAVCETMSIISNRTGVSVSDLINQNPQVEDPDRIYPDQQLWLPPRG